MACFDIDGSRPYCINEIESIRTPSLVVFKDRVKGNIDRMQSYLDEIAPGSGLNHLCAHVKTHKSSHIVRLKMDSGVGWFKTTLNEVEMVARCGARAVFVAYPLLEHDARWLCELVPEHPDTQFFVQIGSMAHAEILRPFTESGACVWHYFIDIDVGMHRTGAVPEKAYHLYESISSWEGFEFEGLHGYDGHNHAADAGIRREEAEASMSCLMDLLHTFHTKGAAVPRVVAAGSITFREDLRILTAAIGSNTEVLVSPGNWIYWDTGYDALVPGIFEFSAFVLAQVIDTGPNSMATLNAGHKRWGADRGTVERFSLPGSRVHSFNEEHTVIEGIQADSCSVGDYVLVCPKHACSTVNLYESFVLIDENGEIEARDVPVDARNR